MRFGEVVENEELLQYEQFIKKHPRSQAFRGLVAMTIDANPRGVRRKFNFRIDITAENIWQMLLDDSMMYPPPPGHLCPIISELEKP